MSLLYQDLTIEQKILTLEYLVPGFERVIDGENITWLDVRPFPSEIEIINSLEEATLTEEIRKRLTIANVICSEKMLEGMNWTFNGIDETVQTRPEDKTNLLGIAMESRYLHSVGMSDPFTPFRVESNNEYPITPQEGITITNAALQHIIEKYRRCWKYKDEIRNSTSINELNNVTFYEGVLPPPF